MEIAQEPHTYPEAINWEAKYNEAVAQHRLTSEAHVALKNSVDKAMWTIGEMVFDEADKNDWDEKAFDLIESINDALPRGFRIPLREREFDVEVTISGTISMHHTVTVKARSQEDAEDSIRDCPDDYFDPDEVLREENIRYVSIDNIEVEVE